MDKAPQSCLSDILRNADGFLNPSDRQQVRADRGKTALLAAEAEWRAAIAAVGQILKTLPRPTTTVAEADTSAGIILSGPLPVINEADLGQRLETWIVTPQPLADALNGRLSLPSSGPSLRQPAPQTIQALPLNLQNPLLKERFCLVVTATFSVGLVLGQPLGGSPSLQYSFDPQVLLTLWQHIQMHISETVLDRLNTLDQRISQIITAPDYRLVTRFSQVLLDHLPHRFPDSALTLEERGHVRLTHWSEAHRKSVITEGPSFNEVSKETASSSEKLPLASKRQDTELLQAMAHEIRTPLTTIRTLTRSLLRRKNLPSEVRKRLSRIDQECTQQIDRFNLIFQAVELQTTNRDRPRSCLTPIALTQIFQDSIPRWQQQAQRRNLSLDVTLPPNLPRITSDPTLLNQVLTGVVEWFTQCLPAQSHIQMRVMLAGHQLKLQFEAEPQEIDGLITGKEINKRQPLKSLGQLLTIAPETGGLSLNLDATKNLFQFLGGKLIVRQRPEQGEVLTVFLPLDTREV
ncbi:MAG: HAMP domain-containing histidine kinase [Leptolyngbya sp. SIO1D8]|nr:HAMP domain-containing histidine kinase [Leptolyngbya sp. SIO1D8]